MPNTLEAALYVQCVHRANAFFRRTGCVAIPSHIELCVIWLMKQAVRNQGRIPADSPANPQTGFPDEYLDNILELAAVEGPYVAALSERDEEAWERMSILIRARVHNYAWRYFGSAVRRGNLQEEDIVQECWVEFADWLSAYPYDCKLEAWITQCVYYKVRGIRESADYKRAMRQVSIDGSDDQDSLGLGETLADDGALHDFSEAEMLLMVRVALRRLPPLQRQAVMSILEGEDVEECSRRLGRSANSIYKLRERARKSLRQYLET